MKLSAFNTVAGANAGVEVRLELDGVPTDAIIRVLGQDADAFVAATREQQRARMDRIAKKGRLQPVSPEQIESEELDLLAVATLGWSGLEDESGDPLPFSRTAARALYESSPLIRAQIVEAIYNRANFLPRSAAG